jgi:secreted trypsin-like serine protease
MYCTNDRQIIWNLKNNRFCVVISQSRHFVHLMFSTTREEKQSKNFFQGDSGGPLFETGTEPILTGIISGTDPSCGTEVIWPSIVTSVGFFRDWIDSQLII